MPKKTTTRKFRTQPIRTTPQYAAGISFVGQLDGKFTYLVVQGEDGKSLGELSGNRLYRLAKAITARFENGTSR